MATTTENYSLLKPVVGEPGSTAVGELNTTLDMIDNLFYELSQSISNVSGGTASTLNLIDSQTGISYKLVLNNQVIGLQQN